MEHTEMQKKGFAIAQRYAGRPIQERLNIIAATFGCGAAFVETSPCGGKWRGTSDISLVFSNGQAMGVANCRTPRAKTLKVKNECVNNALARYNPEIVKEIKAVAAASLLKREGKDNEVAKQKGLKPYTFLNVELCDGSCEDAGGYMGWYYVTLAVGGRIFGFVETGLRHDIERGIVSEYISRSKYFVAGGLNDDTVDFVFNNVGHSSFKGYRVPLSDSARERAEQTLRERQHGQ